MIPPRGARRSAGRSAPTASRPPAPEELPMASITKHVETIAPAGAVWSAMRDVGALHTRLVPGFVVDTVVDGDARIVTFANGMVVREPIIAIDEEHRRVVWSADGPQFEHYSSSA